MVVSVMVPSMNQTDRVSEEYLHSGNMPQHALTRDGSICYGPFDKLNRSGERGVSTLAVCLFLL